MTKEKALSLLSEAGSKKTYFLLEESESKTVLFKTRRQSKIVDGELVGSEVDVFNAQEARVWTSKKNLAAKLAREHDLRVRLMDKEAELFVPLTLADKLLPKFGVKVKRTVSDERLAVMREAGKRLAALRKHDKNALPEG